MPRCSSPAWRAQLLVSGSVKRCVLAHEHRRSDMFDVATITADRRPAAWNENDACLQTFLESAAAHGLRVVPLVAEPGARALGDAPGVVSMTTDLTVLEVSLGPRILRGGLNPGRT